MRFFKDVKGNYCVCLDSETLKWIIVDKNSALQCDDSNQNLIKVFEDERVNEKESEILKDNVYPNPIGISILPTFNCNLKCIHCFYESRPDKSYQMLNRDYIPLIIELINSYNIENVTIGGGEPLTYPHLRKLLTDLLEKTNVKIFLLTNGLLLYKIKDFLKNTQLSIQVSFDATNADTYQKVRGGNFQNLLENIAYLKDLKTDTALSYTIHTINKDEVIKFIKFSEKIGINFLHFPIIENYGRAKINQLSPAPKELIDLYQFLVYYSFHYNKLKIYFVEEIKFRLLNQLRRYNCSALYNQLSLGPDGYLYPCSELIDNRFKICHITELKKLKNFVQQFRIQTNIGTPIVQKICPDCPIKYLCGGGCRAVDFLSGKSYFKAKADSLTCDIFLKSAFTILWELANYELNPRIPLNLLYSDNVFRWVKEYEKHN
ncbi:hypothetical protein BG95_08550 [Thermosipho sp. 1063]|uniref:radical SAM/SPASM domain-containing protein n=1 Tax=unclassified Thermosipho (in: thermotogales) TaxID=2676525 RepID=UPI0009505BD5|nr:MULTISPECIES: radical SAM protein [unclassified Thermosipho (in: thermotogales)]APT72892.1 hypothetical protein BG95_08550 [Thermosipho sp. 1063]OOC42326.1 radical SAM protein [Thermosipho sp. 1074]